MWLSPALYPPSPFFPEKPWGGGDQFVRPTGWGRGKNLSRNFPTPLYITTTVTLEGGGGGKNPDSPKAPQEGLETLDPPKRTPQPSKPLGGQTENTLAHRGGGGGEGPKPPEGRMMGKTKQNGTHETPDGRGRGLGKSQKSPRAHQGGGGAPRT